MQKFKELLSEIGCEEEILTLYRAYLAEDNDKVNLPTDGIIMYINELSAIQGLVNAEEKLQDLLTIVDTGMPVIVLLKVQIPIKGNKEKDLLKDTEAEYWELSGGVTIELSNFDFTLDVDEIKLEKLKTVRYPESNIIAVSEVEYHSTMDPKETIVKFKNKNVKKLKNSVEIVTF